MCVSPEISSVTHSDNCLSFPVTLWSSSANKPLYKPQIFAPATVSEGTQITIREQSTFANKQSVTSYIVPTCPSLFIWTLSCTHGSLTALSSDTLLCLSLWIVRVVRTGLCLSSLYFQDLHKDLLSGFPVSFVILGQGKCLGSGYFTKCLAGGTRWMNLENVLEEKQPWKLSPSIT